MPAAKPPISAVTAKIAGHTFKPNISATRPASRWLFGKLLYKAIPVHRTIMAKNGCQKEIFPVFPIMPQVAKETTMIVHQGKKDCSAKDRISITMKTIVYFFEIL